MTKIEAFWKDATADDVARVMAGETVEARFWDDNLQGWSTRTLSGWQTTGVRPLWHSHDGFVWTRCQVYREPSWWHNKPDPGESFRLLGKFPDEPKLATDECWNPSERKWQQVRNDDGVQEYQAWYRRRIEPVETVERKPFLIRRRVIEIGDEIKLPNGRVLVFNGEGFEVTQ
jgi:hypothetical protein